METSVPVGFELIVLNERGQPCANPATRAIPVFREIFARTRRGTGHAQGLERALKEFLYIYYMIDIRSFAVQRYPRKANDEERHKLVSEKLGFEPKWYPDKVIEDAAEFYEEYHVTPVVKMLKTAFAAINHTIDFLEGVDFNDKKYNPKTVMEYLDNLKEHKKGVEALMQEVVQDINLGGRPKGGGTIGIFENAPEVAVIENYTRMPEAI